MRYCFQFQLLGPFNLAPFAVDFCIALTAAVIAFVYVTILTQPDQVLGFWKKFLHNTYDRITGIDTDANQKYRWVLKPLVDCELCVSGQIALWIFLFKMPLFLIHLIFTICLAILITKILAKKLTH